MPQPLNLPTEPITVEQFYEWVDQQPKGRYELIEGQPVVVAMAPGLVRHARVKLAAYIALRDAIRAAGLPCEVFSDGPAIQVGESTLRVPDVIVNCGDAVDGDSRILPHPVIVLEVLSPSTHRVDTVGKFRDYFRVPSVRHYLILDPVTRVVLHHRREDGGAVASGILGNGQLLLRPPGLTVAVEALFGD